jgi:hypothetical protein
MQPSPPVDQANSQTRLIARFPKPKKDRIAGADIATRQPRILINTSYAITREHIKRSAADKSHRHIVCNPFGVPRKLVAFVAGSLKDDRYGQFTPGDGDRGVGYAFILADCANKAKTAAPQRLDQALLDAVVTDRPPRRIEPVGQNCLRDKAPAPNVLEDFVSAHNAIAFGDEKVQQIENLRLDGDDDRVTPQLAAGDVEHKVFKSI